MKPPPRLPGTPTRSSIYTPIHSLIFTRLIHLKRRIHHISHFDLSSNYFRFRHPKPLTLSLRPQFCKGLQLSILCCSDNTRNASLHFDYTEAKKSVRERVYAKEFGNQWKAEVVNPNVSLFNVLSGSRYSLSDQASFLLAFIACTTSVAFAGFVAAAVRTLLAMTKAATSFAKLADTAREELPSTMAAIRLSGMEISDLTLELSDLSQEISAGVTKSTQIVQAAETGVRQIGATAREHAESMIQERASLPNISLQPFVFGAAKKTSRAIGQATRSFLDFISREDIGSEDEDGDESEEVGREY